MSSKSLLKECYELQCLITQHLRRLTLHSANFLTPFSEAACQHYSIDAGEIFFHAAKS
jgi:hypothetical protein